jgi:hypothetical protein
VAVGAGIDQVVGHLDRCPAGGLLERDLDLHGEVSALDAPTRAAEGAAERVAAEKGVEDVREGAEAVRLGGEAARLEPLEAVAVVGGAPIGVRQDLVRLGGLLELLLRLRVMAVDVRVELAGEAPERPLDLSVLGVAADAEDLIGVAPHSSYTSATKRDSSRAAWRTEVIACR